MRIALGSLCVGLTFLLFSLRAPLFYGNFHSVIPGAVYRSAELDSDALAARITELGIRSIVNLRMLGAQSGDGAGEADEVRLAKEYEVAYFSLPMSAARLAPRGTLLTLLEILDAAPRPILIHCLNGVDRTGFASAVATLAAGDPIERARAQFAVRHGFLAPVSRTDLPAWINLYESWLRTEGKEHSAKRVREFAQTGYTPYFYKARIEPVSFPTRVVAESAHPLAFRVTNESQQSWTFTPTSILGVHLGLRIENLDPASAYEREWRGDTPHRAFDPGESIELSATLPELPAPGRYRVSVDLVDERVVWFSEMGSTPLERIVEVEALPQAPKQSKASTRSGVDTAYDALVSAPFRTGARSADPQATHD